VCEGKTEVGFFRGLDEHWIHAEGKNSFAYFGVTFFRAGGGNRVRGAAEALKELGYDVGVVTDSDAPDEFSDADAEALRNAGITVIKWADGCSIEERVFADLPWAGVLASFNAAHPRFGRDRLLDQIQTQYGPGFDRDVNRWADTPKLRTALGRAAKHSSWFKNETYGREWATAISRYLTDPAMQTTDLARQLRILREWIDRE